MLTNLQFYMDKEGTQMKKALFIALILLLFFISSCGKSSINRDDLVGQWRLQKDTLTIDMNIKGSSDFILHFNLGQNTGERDEETKSWLMGMSMDLEGMDNDCTWRLDENKLKVIDHAMNDVESEFDIIELNEDTLILDIYKKRAEFKRVGI